MVYELFPYTFHVLVILMFMIYFSAKDLVGALMTNLAAISTNIQLFCLVLSMIWISNVKWDMDHLLEFVMSNGYVKRKTLTLVDNIEDWK